MRDKLPTRRGRNTQGQRGLAELSRIYVHWNGAAVSPQPMARYLHSIANYHLSLNWGDGYFAEGISYHYGIDFTGGMWRLRDVRDITWQVGSWPENRIGIGIILPFGTGQKLNQPAIRAAAQTIDELRELYNIPRWAVQGHKEVSATSCPGPAMSQLVIPYREGRL